jgi:hypothetical protein
MQGQLLLQDAVRYVRSPRPPSAVLTPGYLYFSEGMVTIGTAVTNLATADKDLVLVMHFGGSVRGSEALPGLSKKEREAEGLPGCAIRLMYSTSESC